MTTARWSAVEARAGQAVYFNAWGGSERTSAYLWINGENECCAMLLSATIVDFLLAPKRINQETQ
jgi:ABC-type uncharacterized transport system YnjBCD substrate-binding protein